MINVNVVQFVVYMTHFDCYHYCHMQEHSQPASCELVVVSNGHADLILKFQRAALNFLIVMFFIYNLMVIILIGGPEDVRAGECGKVQ